MITPHVLLNRQIPEYVRVNFPVFVEFVKTYYKFLEQSNATQKIEDLGSIQNTLAELIKYFKIELGAVFPSDSLEDERFILEKITQFYKAKGSAESFKFLFRVFFKEEVNIRYPWDNVLIASDGRWYQESFITVSIETGSLPSSTEFFVDFENTDGKFRIQIIRRELVDLPTNSYRMFFVAKSNIVIVDNQLVTIEGSPNFTGRVKKSPNRFKIISGGANWQKGQVVTILPQDGSLATIAKVTSVDNGAITGIEIVQYGIGHSPNELDQLSPYAYKPLGGNVVTQKDLISADPLITNWTLTIKDYTAGISEPHFIGITDSLGANSYFLEDYAERGYAGQTVVDLIQNQPASFISAIDGGITIKQWWDSQAYVEYVFENVTSVKGKFTASNGLLSDQNIRLEDNFYYQRFSYDIESVHSVDEYKVYTDLARPAGTKQFSTLVFSPTLILNTTSETGIPTVKELILDEFDISDSLELSWTRGVVVDDSASTSDSLTTALTTHTLLSDSATVNETLVASIGRNKYLTETVSTADDNTITITLDPYVSENYFAENYVTNTYTLTIGP